MKAQIGVIFKAMELVNIELSELSRACKVPKAKQKKEWVRLSGIQAVLYKAIKDCNLEIELYPELDAILIPFFEEYRLGISH